MLFYVFLCCSMYFYVVLCIFMLFYVFLCSLYYLFCVVLCIVCVEMCTVLLPPGGYPIAVKYVSYHITVCRLPFGVPIWMRLQFHPNLHTKRSPIHSDIYQMSY